ncbi:MAG: hypothetical protein ACE5JI_16360 [Acidobacteriota bacterium]
MANSRRPTFSKRQKELARQERQRLKAEKRAQRKSERTRRAGVGGEDPDIAGIVPGPQPVPWEDQGVPPEATQGGEEDEASGS